MKYLIVAVVGALMSCAPAMADTRPDSHAPIGVMGDHLHHKGEWMFSYRYMHMSMQGNRDGTSGLSAEDIVTGYANRFANPPMMPPTLRVVPVDMTMQMHMFGMMYAPDHSVTLMGMVNYVDKEMDHLTFQGPMGATQLGTFTTRTTGLGDTTLSALVRLPGTSNWHATLGVSLPTGATDETGTVLTPMNMQPELRLPYPMQLGSGTVDVLAGLTVTRHGDRFGGGAQWRSVVRTGDNDEGYSLGDEHVLTGWLSYELVPSTSVSARLSWLDRGNIDGIDPLIMAPVQTADPDRQGAERMDFALGANFVLPAKGHRLALEFSAPVYQRLDGPQLETDWQLTLGWQYAP